MTRPLRRSTLLPLALAAIAVACTSTGGAAEGTPDGAGGGRDAGGAVDTPGAGADGVCAPNGGPRGEPPPLALERVLPDLAVTRPVHLAAPPDGSGRVFVVAQPGTVHVASGVGEGATTSVWLDLRARVDDGPGEAGLLSIAFHPDFATNGRFFLDYTRSVDGQLQSVVSRFRVPDPPLGAPDPASEEVLLVVDQPFGNHNGGQLAFGPDGLLYVGLGDGGSGGDPRGNGQDRGTLLGAILRLDVDAPPAEGLAYAIPADNPFVDTPGVRGEIWAWGLRNPWRFSFDPVTGALWAGDVGQNAVEEIDVVVAGGNYGWNRMEGTRCYPPGTECDPSLYEAPVAEYGRDEGRSVTGGFVYRGGALPALDGVYVFGDFASGVIWGLAPDGDGGHERTMLAETDLLLSSFGRDAAGELYALDHGDGAVYRLVAADPDAAGVAGWRPLLSETGCFADTETRTLAAGLRPYAVNAPLWSDGAAKERAVGLPEGARLGYRTDGAWTLPNGGVLVKTFLLGGRPLETRFLVRDGAAHRFATYRWDEAGRDAHLLDGRETAAVPTGDVGAVTWTFPSPRDCVSCHTTGAGVVLGLTTAQLNRPGPDGGDNQIAALDAAGWLAPAPPAAPAALPRFPDPADDGAPLADRARAHLHANCAHCHRPGGAAASRFDIRATTPPGAGDWCDVPAGQGDLGVAGAAVVAPGAPERSVVWLRMVTAAPEARMPPLAVSVVDEEGAALVEAWIAALEGCGGR